MDGMTSTPVNPAPAAAPVAAPAPTPTPAPTTTMPSSSGGGKIVDIFKRMNMLEIGFGVLGAAALFSAIYYYRYSMTMSKTLSSDLSNKIDELEIKVSDVQSALERDRTSTNGQVFS